jgi:hypothetical protein
MADIDEARTAIILHRITAEIRRAAELVPITQPVFLFAFMEVPDLFSGSGFIEDLSDELGKAMKAAGKAIKAQIISTDFECVVSDDPDPVFYIDIYEAGSSLVPGLH